MHRADPEKKRKRRKRFRVFMEIVFLVLGVISGVMAYPYTVIIPIIIGAIRIISKAVEKEKEPPATQPVVYCNGEKEPKRKRTASKVETVTIPPARVKTALKIDREIRSKK